MRDQLGGTSSWFLVMNVSRGYTKLAGEVGFRTFL